MGTHEVGLEIPVLLTWPVIGGRKRRPGRRLETAEWKMNLLELIGGWNGGWILAAELHLTRLE